MSLANASPTENHLLHLLPALTRNRLLQHGEQVDLLFGHTLHLVDTPMTFVYFPVSGFISVIASVPDHPALEVGVIGNEGMLGVSYVLGIAEAPLQAIVQGAGTALRIPLGAFRNVLDTDPDLRLQLNRYLYLLMTQLPKTLACTHFHEVGPRLARWLLLTHDRAHSDHLQLTHQFLADMLGVQRSAITIAAGLLQKRKLIQYFRGSIQICNRAGLRAAACRCYDIANEDYRRIIDEARRAPSVH
ncbi:MAG TPA: Crp/Fnr family transcriptional regulator [Permianibacter sp.]|nr:Crp/Fnr family transcriptional regulator [Permianibacter sp.]